MTVWFASGNEHKKRELTAILADRGWDGGLRSPADVGLDFAPEETEDSFRGNAMLKARALRDLLYAKGLCSLEDGDAIVADDSGLCVDALGGRPGIHSARYAGAPGAECADPSALTAGDRNALLLGELGDSPDRGARFVCAMTVMFAGDRFFDAYETIEGEIVRTADLACGAGGFGYDPIFLVKGSGRTLAEFSEEEKNAVSHRGRAGAIIAGFLRSLVCDR